MTAVTLLDGGLATQLEAAGADLSGVLWSARVLADEPGRIVAAHEAFFAAGAEVAISSSYQASFAGFARAGVDHDRAAALMRRSVELARSPGKLVAASVGPYGATLADGSEYTGDYGLSVEELRAFHRPRLQVLASARPDLLAVETIPALAEVRAVCAELTDVDVPAWLSVTSGAFKSEDELTEAFAVADACPAVIAIGVNCIAPDQVAPALALAASVSGKPKVAYPNSGEGWDALARAWTGEPEVAEQHVRDWLDLGARYVGGCCRVSPAQIARIASIIAGWQAAACPAAHDVPSCARHGAVAAKP